METTTTSPATTNPAADWIAQLRPDALLPRPPAYKDFGKVSRETYHDYAAYVYVLDPWADRPSQAPVGLEAPLADNVGRPATEPAPAQVDPVALSWLEAEAAQAVEAFIAEARRAAANPAAFDEKSIRLLMERFLVRATAELAGIYLAPQYIPGRRSQLLLVFMERALPDLVDAFGKLPAEHREAFLRYLDVATSEWVGRASVMERPWLWANEHYQSPNNWASVGYELSEVYQRLPDLPTTVPPPGSMASEIVYPPPPTEEPHLLVWERPLRDFTPYGWHTLAVHPQRFEPIGKLTVLFVTPTLRHVPSPTDLLREAERLLALVPPPDPAKPWLIELVDQLAGGLVRPPKAGDESKKEQDVYGFRPYPSPSINIGLQILYRQTWRSLDPGRGELVRTIPLGPGQTEKVSVRRLQREKVTRELTDTSSTETERETSAKTTVSSEIVEEAARSSKWHIDQGGEGGVNMGVWGVKGTTDIGYESESSSSSRDTKKRLNDVAQRTTAKMRRESRVVVTTERETTFEATQASEIRNPNDSLAVTFYYYALQQQYEVSTRLAAVEPVLLVAEPLPRPSEMTIAWIQRYDWLIGENLLDESFREILSKISTFDLEGVKKEIEAKEVEVTTLRDAVVQAQASLGVLNGLPGNVGNTYEGTLKAYQEAVKSALELARQVQGMVRDAQRLGQHVVDNILHYMRGIWGAEDPDRRRMRFSAVMWPTQFTTVIDGSASGAGGTSTTVFGHFAPVSGSELPLSELIDPTGPIAFAGNYLVFRLRKTAQTAGLTSLLRERQREYTYQTFVLDPDVGNADLTPASSYAGEQFEIKMTAADPAAADPAAATSYQVSRTPVRPDTDGEDVAISDGGKLIELRRAGVRVALDRVLNQDEVLRVMPGPLKLRDPELSYLLGQRPTAKIEDLEKELEAANTRTIVVDTDNVSVEMDPSPLLEPFKQVHQFADGIKAVIDAQRYSQRLDAKMYGNPAVGIDGDTLKELLAAALAAARAPGATP